jgi:hypothetical protein
MKEKEMEEFGAPENLKNKSLLSILYICSINRAIHSSALF